MLEQGLIERIKRGCYHWVEDYGTSEVVIVNRLFPDAVLCMETAHFIIDTVTGIPLNGILPRIGKGLFLELKCRVYQIRGKGLI